MLPSMQARALWRLSNTTFAARTKVLRSTNGLSASLASRLCSTSAPIPGALKRRYNYDGQDTVPLPPDLEGDRVSIKAYYLGRSVDIVKAFQNLYGNSNHVFHSKSVIATLDEQKRQHVAVFKYGAVVFFNVDEEEQQHQLRRIKQATQSPVADGLGHAEDYTLVVSHSLQEPSVFQPAYLMLKNLDKHNLSIVGTVMAQTVALDHYTVLVDRMLDTFIDINEKIEHSGKFNAGDKRRLFQLIASNSTVITDVLSKLGIFDKSDVAWKYADYTPAWEGLREEFEVEERFKHLEYKLELIKDNTRFFLDMLHNQKSNNLEWIIIFLIAAELGMGLLKATNFAF